SMPSDGEKFTPDSSHSSSQSEPDPTRDEPIGPDALADALHRVAEAREYVVHLAAVEIERLKLRFRRAAVWAVAGITALVLLLVAAAGLMLEGLAELVGSLLGNRPWLGAVVVGSGVLLIAVAAVIWALWSWQASAYDTARERFAARRRRQKARFGRSVDSSEND